MRRIYLRESMDIQSMLCRQRDFGSRWYERWRDEIARIAPMLAEDQKLVWGAVWQGMQGKCMHRKLWEWCAIARALEERDMLRSGRRGIGFAVGQEPLSSLFAARGADILASDFSGEGAAEGWAQTAQRGDSLENIHWPRAIPLQQFKERVVYQDVDMRNLDHLPKSHFDFSWSSCSFEHLGTLDLGLKFLMDAMACLKPGGVAVHTTEYNVSSNGATVEAGPNVIYRRRDIEQLDMDLRQMRCGIESIDLDPGADPHDIGFDFWPFYQQGSQHVKLQLDGYVCTSLLLIVRKASC